MKKQLLFGALLCAGSLAMQGAQTQYEFYVFRTDGAVHTIANASVDSITFEKKDMSGSPTELYTTQVIHMKTGEKLRLNLSDIEITYVSDPMTQPEDSTVDLGLSVGWRTCNLGAPATADYGDLVGWGDPTGKHHEQYHNPSFGSYNANKNSCLEYYGGITPPDDISGTELDIASVQLGGDWRMPTYDEMAELREKTTSRWMTYRGAEGIRLVGPNGNSIFLPAGGRRRGESMTSAANEFGGYWTSAWYGNYTGSTSAIKGEMAWGLNFGIQMGKGFMTIASSYRYSGMCIRPVKSLK